MKTERIAEVGYSKDGRSLELVVPHGTKMTDLSKIIEYMARDVFTKLPRGCSACHSGDHLNIRERLENVIRVDLDSHTIIAK